MWIGVGKGDKCGTQETGHTNGIVGDKYKYMISSRPGVTGALLQAWMLLCN